MRLVLCVVAGRRKPSKTHGQGAPLNPSAVRLLFLHQKDYMSKADDLLEYFKNHVGEWACSMCGSHSVQPAATFRTLKNAGWQFEEISPQRWGKQMFCPVCGQETTHYKLKSLQQGLDKSRLGITPAQKKRVISIIGDVDAFTGASVKSSLEIDHKVPFDRLKETEDSPRPKTMFEVGEHVRAIEGAFKDFVGTVEKVDYEKNRLTVSIAIFGRATPVELDFTQVEKDI